jgi:hypothetical protein
MFRFAPLLVLVLLPACAVSRSTVNKVVITENKGVVEKCTKVADLDGAPLAGSLLLRDPRRDAVIAKLKSAAAEQGATHVQAAVADIKWKGRDTAGVAYKCPTAT